MSKKKEDIQKKPYMYIVQPEISPPDPNMQSQFRAIIGEDEVKVVEVEEGVVVNEIRVVSTESMNDEAVKQETDDDSQNENLVVEMSTAVTDHAIDGSEESVNQINQGRNRKKTKSFSEMTKEEIVYFLAKMPAAVPKPICIIKIDGEEFRGQVEKQKGDLFLLKLDLDGQGEFLQVSMEEIEAIEVENL